MLQGVVDSHRGRSCSIWSIGTGCILQEEGTKGGQLGAARGKRRAMFSDDFSSFFLFLFSSLFKVVMLKLLDYPSLSHIVIQVPPAAGNKVKKYNIQKLLA